MTNKEAMEMATKLAKSFGMTGMDEGDVVDEVLDFIYEEYEQRLGKPSFDEWKESNKEAIVFYTELTENGTTEVQEEPEPEPESEEDMCTVVTATPAPEHPEEVEDVFVITDETLQWKYDPDQVLEITGAPELQPAGSGEPSLAELEALDVLLPEHKEDPKAIAEAEAKAKKKDISKLSMPELRKILDAKKNKPKIIKTSTRTRKATRNVDEFGFVKGSTQAAYIDLVKAGKYTEKEIKVRIQEISKRGIHAKNSLERKLESKGYSICDTAGILSLVKI